MAGATGRMGDKNMNMIGLIFSNIHDAKMGELTKQRTLASVPFGGRYRLVDFVLSNMVNSDITTIGVITKQNYQSLMDHLGSCEEWDLNRKDGGLFILPPFGEGQTSVYRGKLEALYGAEKFLARAKGEYVLLSDCNVICNIDYRLALKSHIESGAVVTVICNREDPAVDGETKDLVLQADDDGKVTEVLMHTGYTKDNLIGMGMYILKKDLLVERISKAAAQGMYDFERDFLQLEFNQGILSMNTYEHKFSVLRNVDVPSYFANNLKLMDDTVRQDIFAENSPVYTKVRDEAPTFYMEGCQVDNCLIADGCRIEGSMANTLLFRDVSVAKGAQIKNCIIMQGSDIGADCYLENAIIDKDVTITAGKTLVGAPNSPIIIQKGGTV